MATPKKGTAATKGGQGPDDANDGQNKSTSSTAGLEVTATHAGFRRAGMVWSNKPIQVKCADLTDEQIALLKACPGLKVKEIDLKANEVGQVGDDDLPTSHKAPLDPEAKEADLPADDEQGEPA